MIDSENVTFRVQHYSLVPVVIGGVGLFDERCTRGESFGNVLVHLFLAVHINVQQELAAFCVRVIIELEQFVGIQRIETDAGAPRVQAAEDG